MYDKLIASLRWDVSLRHGVYAHQTYMYVKLHSLEGFTGSAAHVAVLAIYLKPVQSSEKTAL